MNSITDQLSLLFKNWSGNDPDSVSALSVSGSDRLYFRLANRNATALGAYHPNPYENKAFQEFTRHFLAQGMPVPEIYISGNDPAYYLLQDLGDTSLFSLLEQTGPDGKLADETSHYYKESLEQLARFQLIAGKGLDYSFCYPRRSFDRQSMQWDLNYFKYNFLKLAGIPFEEQALEEDFNTLIRFLEEAGSDYFMYRDFQARNIMIHNNKPYFIDYQGGRKGPIQYDVASLLFQVRAGLPADVREKLLAHYMNAAAQLSTFDQKDFLRHYYGFVLLRLLQVLGAYGYRGLFEKKEHFILSIPYATSNLNWFLQTIELPVRLPELERCIEYICREEETPKKPTAYRPGRLHVSVNSFSYKNAVPEDRSGNGGGYVFDCRALPNPGREEQFRAFNGRDEIIKDYMKRKPETGEFLVNTIKLVEGSIENYLDRGFNHLMISFGCTGGQHRSVYCAEAIALHLRTKFDVDVHLEHQELDISINYIK